MSGLAKKKIFRLTKGYMGRAKNCYRISMNRLDKALTHNYRDRKRNTRQQRSSWILQLNSASREHGVRYSDLIWGLSKCNMRLNRKVLSVLALTEPYSFKAVVDSVRELAELPYRPTVLELAKVGLIQSSVVTGQVIYQTPQEMARNSAVRKAAMISAKIEKRKQAAAATMPNADVSAR